MTEPAADIAALFEPIRIGTMQLRNRVMLPPHARLIGNPFGTTKEAHRFVTYFQRRARDGAAWIGGLNCYVDKPLIPGFEPGGIGARWGDFRLPVFRERAAQYAEAIHAAGAYATAQLTVQGGAPFAPSPMLATYASNVVPHVLGHDEIKFLVSEYAFSARECQVSGLDGVELHANHGDLLQLFLSPATNLRADAYGGDPARRLRLITDVLQAIRDDVGTDFTVGVRLSLDEMFEGGYDLRGGAEIAATLAATGLVDYLSFVVGNNWGAPSYLQTHHYRPAQWADAAGHIRQMVTLPVVYAGRISDPQTAAAVIRAGHADVVGIARAMLAEDQFVSKAAAGNLGGIRPCIGTNDCIHRVTVEGLRFGCSVNPGAGRETEPEPAPAGKPQSVLVAGGGPAGLELAALLAAKGHSVSLWEREAELGGQVRTAARAAENQSSYLQYLDFQRRQLERLNVTVKTGYTATSERVLAAGFTVVAVATGAMPRRPTVPGIDLPHIIEGRDVLDGKVDVGIRVVVIAMEDHMQPLTIAGFLADLGKQVRLIYASPSIAPLVGPYSIGAPLAKLSRAGAEITVCQRLVSVETDRLMLRNIYSGAPSTVCDCDSVVLACGGISDAGLYDDLAGRVPSLHVLGDAYAPRRISFATRQAFELARKF